MTNKLGNTRRVNHRGRYTRFSAQLTNIISILFCIIANIMIGINELFIFLLGVPVGMILLSVMLWKTYGALRNSAIAGAAETLWEEIKQSGKCDYNFVLFLRPLFATGVLPIKQKLSLFRIIFTPDIIFFSRLLAEDYRRRKDIEWFLADSISPDFLIIAIGGEFLDFGVPRIMSSDDDWRDKFDLLSEEAAAIIIIPADQEGTMWEVKRILSSHLVRKTIFCMPNDAPISRLKTLDQNDSEKKENLRESNLKKLSQSGLMGLQLMNLAKDLNVDLGDVESTMFSTVWNRTRAHLQKEGIEIPVFRKSGGVFGVIDGKATKMVSLKSSALRKLLRNRR